MLGQAVGDLQLVTLEGYLQWWQRGSWCRVALDVEVGKMWDIASTAWINKWEAFGYREVNRVFRCGSFTSTSLAVFLHNARGRLPQNPELKRPLLLFPTHLQRVIAQLIMYYLLYHIAEPLVPRYLRLIETLDERKHR